MGVNASIPNRTRDFLQRDVMRREHVIGVIKRVYEAHGFEPLETPSIENLDTLLGKYGEEGDQLLFKILKRGAKAATGECDLGLRYDLTVPLARVYAMHLNELPRFFKRYQIQPVWRADRPGHGRFREFYQCDIDIVGARSNTAEVDLLSAVGEVFDALGFEDTTLRLNDRRVLRGLIAVSGVSLAREVDAITAIDKLDKIGLDGVRGELAQRGVDPDAGAALITHLTRLSEATDLAAALEALFEGREEARAAVAGLRQILAGLEASGLAPGRVRIDPYLARGLSYYTGPIFEVAHPELAGSLAGGGRYDGLIGMFLGREVPSVGVSLGLERILVVMEERGMFDALRGGCDVMLAYFGDRTRLETLSLANRLRRAGLRVDLYPQKDKLGKQFRYADDRSIPFVALLGPDEDAAGEVSLKNMVSGEQQRVSQASLVERILQRR